MSASNRLLYLKRRFERDDPLSVADNDLWQSYLSGLHELETSRVPRCLLPKEEINIELSELHAFCDASVGLPRDQWPLSVVKSCETDQDGLVCTLEIRTKGAHVKREVRRVDLFEGIDQQIKK